MRYTEITGEEVLLEIATDRKGAIRVMEDHLFMITIHILKLAGEDDETNRHHWSVELLSWLDLIRPLRLKPDNRPLKAKLIFKVMFQDPYGSTPEMWVKSFMRRIVQEGNRRNDRSDVEIANIMERFMTQFAALCATGHETERDIVSLIDQLPKQ